MNKKASKQIGNHILTLETGRVAKQADGAVLVTYGDSTVLATVCVDRRSDTMKDFLPLTVEYREKSYAIGKIPGNFFRREGRPNTKEILSARLIDRPLRPLFPKGFTNEIQIIVNVLSSDQENDQDVLGLIGSSAACALSPVPLEKIVSGVHVGYIDGEYVINPTFHQLDTSDLDIVVAGSETDILMVEGNAHEVSEEIVLGAIEFAKSYISEICSLQREFIEGIAKPEMAYELTLASEEMIADIRETFSGAVKEAFHIADKSQRGDALTAIFNEVVARFGEKYPASELKLKMAFTDLESSIMRDMILREKTRSDGRTMSEIRPVAGEVSVLPRTHGSALFTRGQTQALAVVTLGTKLDERMIDDLEGTSFKSYMLDYNFPPFSVGEVRQMRGTSRRETGHGHLSETAIAPVIPSEEVFPYTIRVVSDILESNGSSSMATVCAGSMSLMDAGVPVKTAVAGIAMGLFKEGDSYEVLSDIIGDEDHFGDMDFKIDGLDMRIVADALIQAREGREHILGIMNETIAAPRESISKYAPSIITMKIDPNKIGAVIGQGGKVIKGIQEQTGATISIEDDGTVIIAAVDMAAGQAAYDTISAIVEEPIIGKIYKGTVKRITTFGAFVEILPSKEALIHISELDTKRVKSVEDVVKIGDVIDCKVIGIDDQGKVKCSRKAALVTSA
jgi:polyribonucleotide nucleotidyltransferase